MKGHIDGVVGTAGESDLVDGPPPLRNVGRVGVRLLTDDDDRGWGAGGGKGKGGGGTEGGKGGRRRERGEGEEGGGRERERKGERRLRQCYHHFPLTYTSTRVHNRHQTLHLPSPYQGHCQR